MTKPQPPVTKGMPITMEHVAQAWYKRIPGVPMLLLIGALLLGAGAVIGFVAGLLWRA